MLNEIITAARDNMIDAIDKHENNILVAIEEMKATYTSVHAEEE